MASGYVVGLGRIRHILVDKESFAAKLGRLIHRVHVKLGGDFVGLADLTQRC